MDNGKPFSLPTMYRGVQFRSRFEARIARALDGWPCEWEYEPLSFVLPCGDVFMPDFRIADGMRIGWPFGSVWLECRGYRSERGERQLREFPLVMPADDAFLIVRPKDDTVRRISPSMLARLAVVGRGLLAAEREDCVDRSIAFLREVLEEELATR